MSRSIGSPPVRGMSMLQGIDQDFMPAASSFLEVAGVVGVQSRPGRRGAGAGDLVDD